MNALNVNRKLWPAEAEPSGGERRAEKQAQVVYSTGQLRFDFGKGK